MFNKFFINKSNLIENINNIKAQKPNVKICAMVKANAYGVGAKEVVEILNDYVDFFGVVNSTEAENIKNLTNKKILITGGLDTSHIDSRFSYTCNSLEDVMALKQLDKPLNIHIKINTGMNRYGISKINEFKTCLNALKNSKLNLEGVYTHFATTDSFVEHQLLKFNKFISVLKQKGLSAIVHADNSHVFDTRHHNFDMARIGFNLYNNTTNGYKPVVTIKTTITQVNKVKSGDVVGYDRRFVANRPMKIAILPIGYADGFDLDYIGLKLNIAGTKCSVLNVCMDCFMLDITDTKLKKGDTVYILNNVNPLSLYAKYATTSEYLIMCRFGAIRADKEIVL